MSTSVFLIFCFLFIACSDGAMTTKERNEDIITVTDKVSKRHNAKLEIRQSESACKSQLQISAPSYCNATFFVDGISYLTTSLSDAEKAILNRFYSQVCVPACMDPIERYYRCLSGFSSAEKNYFITKARKGVCGQESGEFCFLRFARQYREDKSFDDPCTSFTGTGISCSGASSDCLSFIRTFSSRMGCCTEPYLGSGVRSCSGISVDAACTGVVSSTTGVVSSAAVLTAPVFMMIFALVGFFA